MASLKRASKLMEDVTCPICIEILQDPVTTDCGHNFCLQCINQVGKTTENLQCPLCKLPVNKNMLRPNKLLASIAEKIQAMDPAEFQTEEVPRCPEHKEKFHYFCEKYNKFLCRECRVSRDHKTHEVTLIHEAAQNYKGIKNTLSRDKEFEFHNPTPVPMNREKKINEVKARHEPNIESLMELTDNLTTEGKEDKRRLLQKNKSELLSSVPMTLDSTSADLNLTFSQDLKKASLYVIDGTLNTQAKPRQFYSFHCVRGSPGLSSGRVLWEVEIQGPPDRVGIVGVVAELPRGSQIQNSEPCCLWALRISSSGCQPITNSSIQKNLSICLRKVGIYVDYDRGDVIFYDAITSKHIYTFQTSFDRQVFPLFGLLNHHSSITLRL
ncbi:E3 ubiquitin-protein ligase TRIM31-like [Microtus oregoni]|uniref:E3 ubiquitin-protein ligase TRIM31-like n=1 Tax=Microtus oregoni TaxID=111838 RepID=UPI001BB10CCE|nr:E3 ubiquitin-protein ligase TRIM31-like [Microtus oregoni]